MARAEAPLSNYPGWPTTRQTDEKDLYLKARSKTVIISVFACKLKALANSKESYPLADRLAVLAVDSINSTCTYYSTVNKRMRLLTSLYGNSELCQHDHVVTQNSVSMIMS